MVDIGLVQNVLGVDMLGHNYVNWMFILLYLVSFISIFSSLFLLPYSIAFLIFTLSFTVYLCPDIKSVFSSCYFFLSFPYLFIILNNFSFSPTLFFYFYFFVCIGISKDEMFFCISLYVATPGLRIGPTTVMLDLIEILSNFPQVPAVKIPRHVKSSSHN